ncbi:MAG: hypothetical protein QM674_09445 [Burkholderiaceae bacterium]
MHTTIYVISDLHLGGAPAADGARGFQIFPASTQAMLAAFIDRLPAPSTDRDCRLVIAGDIVDFLAEQPFEAFSADQAVAGQKLRRIFEQTAPVWDALRRFVKDRGGALTLMLGNHDIELSLPGPRQILLARLGPGRVDFIYDNEACTYGRVLIEHGNRFDAWNAVPHGALRRVRSQLSRRLPVAPAFPALPGSKLVIDVMNPLKADYPFIDLLKPEDAGALPIAAALGAVGVRDAWRFFRQFRQQWRVDYDEETGEPIDQTLINAGDDADQRMFDLAEDIAAGGEAGQVSALGDALKGAANAVHEQVRAARREALYRALRGQSHRHRDAFAIDKEIDTYLVPAHRSAAAGFDVVVYGHTHLAKRVRLGDGSGAMPVYLNTGTWADLMRVPDEVWGPDEAAGRDVLKRFVDDLERSELDHWRRAVPTYARIDLDGDAVLAADVHFAADDAPISTESLMQRLAAESGHA